MSEQRYIIDAVHPINKRVIEYNLTKEELDKLVEKLKAAGYDEKDMLIVNHKKNRI